MIEKKLAFNVTAKYSDIHEGWVYMLGNWEWLYVSDTDVELYYRPVGTEDWKRGLSMF